MCASVWLECEIRAVFAVEMATYWMRKIDRVEDEINWRNILFQNHDKPVWYYYYFLQIWNRSTLVRVCTVHFMQYSVHVSGRDKNMETERVCGKCQWSCGKFNLAFAVLSELSYRFTSKKHGNCTSFLFLSVAIFSSSQNSLHVSFLIKVNI